MNSMKVRALTSSRPKVYPERFPMPDHRIPAIDRAIDVLDALAGRPGATITELAAALKIPRSTVYRLLNSLEAHAVVVKDGEGAYQLGPRLLRLAQSVTVGVDLVSLARSRLNTLAVDLDCSVKLSVRDAGTALVIAVAESPKTYSITTQVGRRFPLHAGAASKVLLAYADDAVVDDLLSVPLAKVAPATITRRDVLTKELERIRKRGFAEDRGEFAEGVHAVAAPVFGANGDCVGAVSVPYVASTDPSRASAIRDAVIATAGVISVELGARRTT
jgi:DNA-binding IclR family transcriptional regulator